jgi:ribosomal protein L7/L12
VEIKTTNKISTKTMEKVSKELEQKIIELVKSNKVIEAITLVQSKLKLGLKNSKDIVDKYRQVK